MDELSRLALAAAVGDHVAARRFVRETQPKVWELCSFLGSGDDTDDLVQDTYVRALRALPNYRAEGPVLQWLLAIARRVCADEVRRRTRARRRVFRLATLTVRHAAPEPGSGIDLDQLVRALDPDRRAAFVLTQLVGLTYEEAADVCDCAVGTIRSRVARARTELVQLAQEADAV
ncbi:MAG TPA: sigma-70 family RNA polymerase sigma factor [Acidimicrobiia bacterium]